MIPNLRDVGQTVNILSGTERLREGRLFRGGTVNRLFSADELPPVRTVLNLRKGPDRAFDGFHFVHLPAEDSLNNYKTERREVRAWILSALAALQTCEWPVLVHCTAGRDRTGVVVAAVLAAVGVDRQWIFEDYLLSDGIHDPADFESALDGIFTLETLFNDTALISDLRSSLVAGGCDFRPNMKFGEPSE